MPFETPKWPEDGPFFVQGDFGDGPELFFGFKEPEYNAKFKGERDDLINTLNRHVGYHTVTGYRMYIPLGVIGAHLETIVDELRDVAHKHTDEAIAQIQTVATAFLEEQKRRLEENAERGEVLFEDLPLLFKADDELIAEVDGELVGGIYREGKIRVGWMTTTFEAEIEVIHNIGGSLQSSNRKISMMRFVGYGKLAALPLRKITEAEKTALTARGEVFRSCMGKASYMSYKGQLVRSSYWSSKSYRSDGRVMIDADSFRQVDNDQWDSEKRASNVNVGDDDEGVSIRSDYVIPADDLWRTYPFVYGFSFASKQWGRLAVSGLSAINWREDAFDKLVLPEKYKELVKALVQFSGTASFSDLIEGKGGGTIFMLDGPPGQGKTLTAETIAEELKRPLYSISIGELGTDPDTLEQRLRGILDIAMIWDAVLLLDEADIFLEARNETDIVRNAMVGVFLRLLEYHQGVLFLTTNRVRNIDEAFLSRISVSIHFDEADATKRRKVWVNLLTAAGLRHDMYVEADDLRDFEIDALAQETLNGRQIKNVIRQAQTLAKARNRKVDLALLREVITISRPHAAKHLGEGLDEAPRGGWAKVGDFFRALVSK